jgi:peroxiredoxin
MLKHCFLCFKKFIFGKNTLTMKQILSIFILSLVISCQSKAKEGYQIIVKAPGIHNGMRAYLKGVNEQGRLIDLDTAIVVDEQFSFEGTRTEPSLEYLFINGIESNISLIVENTDIEIIAEKDSLHTSKITGTDNNQFFSSFIENQKALGKKHQELMSTLRNNVGDPDNSGTFAKTGEALKTLNETIANSHFSFINEHKNSYAAVIILENKTYDPQAPLDKIESSFDVLSNELKTSSYGKRISTFITAKKTEKPQIKIGDIAPDFSAPNPEGKTISLNEIKGKVTIIDFWASWCGPCRNENPNVVKMYNKYHDKGLEIIGVSLDREGQKDRWEKAIADDELNWHHVSNLKFWQDPIAQLYSIRSIPATYILDQDGKIVATNLRGQDLENKVAELLN